MYNSTYNVTCIISPLYFILGVYFSRLSTDQEKKIKVCDPKLCKTKPVRN